MMGLYFAATGMGNRMAGFIGNASQSEPISIELKAGKTELQPFLQAKKESVKREENRLIKNKHTDISKVKDSTLAKDKDFMLSAVVYPKNGQFEAMDTITGRSLLPLIKFDNPERIKEVTELLAEDGVTKAAPYHVDFKFNKRHGEEDKYKLGYQGSFIVQEVQTSSEFRTFIGIVIFTALFGIIVIFFIKPLKRLTHGVEEAEGELPEQEKFKLGQSENE